MIRSSGIVTYKIEDNKIKVLLCHFGGPYWDKIDNGAWSFSKGEYTKEEGCIEAAKREFNEEVNVKIDTEIKYLLARKVSNKKLVIMFYINKDIDINNCKSNTFELEYPKGSGKIQNFPEMDKYEWMDLEKAKDKIIKNQLPFLLKLEEKINL